MNKMMAGLALMAGIAIATPESGIAQMTMSGSGLTSGMSVQQTVDQSQSSLNNSGMGVFISSPGSISGSTGSLHIERFETRHRRLYAVVSLGDLLDASGMSPSLFVSSTPLSPASSNMSWSSSSGTRVYMDNRYSAIYNDTATVLLRSSGHGFVDIEPGGLADNDGNFIDIGEPGIGDDGENLIDIDEGGIADNDGNIIDFGSPGVGDDGVSLIDIDEGGIDGDGNLIDLGKPGVGSGEGLVDIDEGGIDGDGNLIDIGEPGVGLSSSGYTVWDNESGRLMINGELSSSTLASFDRDMLVAVPVSVSSASCDEIQLNLDVSALSGDRVRRDGYNHVTTDRTLEMKADLVPVTISASQLSSTSSTPVTMVSDETSSAMCMVSSLVSGKGSRLAIVDHLNMVVGAPTTSELQAMR